MSSAYSQSSAAAAAAAIPERRSTGGYALDRFLDRGSIPKRLCCSICTEVLREPRKPAGCLHLFCSSCIDSWLVQKSSSSGSTATCPVCRVPINRLVEVDEIVRQMIGDLTCHCECWEERDHNSCQWVGELSSLESHLKICDWLPNRCDYCAGPVPRRLAGDHLQTCPMRPVTCSFCSDVVPRQLLNAHQSKGELKGPCAFVQVSCPECKSVMARHALPFHLANLCLNVVVSCFYSAFGCTFSGTREALVQHESNDVALHLRCIVIAASQQSSSVAAIPNQVFLKLANATPVSPSIGSPSYSYISSSASSSSSSTSSSMPASDKSAREQATLSKEEDRKSSLLPLAPPKLRFTWSPAHSSAQLTISSSLDTVRNLSSKAPRARSLQALVPSVLNPFPSATVKVVRFPEQDKPLYFGIAAETAYRREDEEQLIFPGSVCFLSIWSSLVRVYESGDPIQAFSGSFQAGDFWAVQVEQNPNDGKWQVTFYHNHTKFTFCTLRRAANSNEPLFPYVRLFSKAEVRLPNL